jgi:hypothetical protein
VRPEDDATMVTSEEEKAEEQEEEDTSAGATAVATAVASVDRDCGDTDDGAAAEEPTEAEAETVTGCTGACAACSSSGLRPLKNRIK